MFNIKLFQIICVISILICVMECRIGVKLTNLKCTILNEEILQIEKCSLKAVKRDIVEITVYIKLLLKPVNNASLQLSFKRRGDHKSKPLYRYKIDACEFMSRKRRNPVAEIFFNSLGFQKYSNMNHSCPYDHDIQINSRLDTEPLNFLSIAQGEYTIYTTWSIHAKPSIQADISIRVS